MFCYNCGKQLPDQAKFCSYCGAKLESDNTQSSPIEEAAEVSLKNETKAPEFSLIIEDAFPIPFSGAVIRGMVEDGTIGINQAVIIQDFADTSFKISGLENSGANVETAQEGDYIGMLLSGLSFSNKEDLIGKRVIGAVYEESTQDNGEFIPNIAGPISYNGTEAPVNNVPPQEPSQQQQSEGYAQQNFNPQQNTNPQNNAPANNSSFVQTPPAENQNNYDNSFYMTALVTLRTGNGATIFSAIESGTLTVTSNGITYEAKLGSSKRNHSYGIDQIAHTKLGFTHAGLQPYLGYTVTLKNGTTHVYVISPIYYNKFKTIDAYILSKMR